MKAKLTVKYWEEDAERWPFSRLEHIVFARQTDDGQSYFACHRRGSILTGQSAIDAVAAGVAEEIPE